MKNNLIAAGQSSAPALGKAFALNSGRVAMVNGVSEFGDQYVSNILVNEGIDEKFGLSHLDWGGYRFGYSFVQASGIHFGLCL
ncbi:hypothetical protein SAMN04488513_1188 [Pseudozobellia thermophila]|uniref:Uncharacterized protein n=1 Tax=Pseudozobellia thermophila TaxID=192903 RepID=A0A1M6P4I1_9FLAO|nr:hypothetical protein SAMN04488513_1188 [Pseudozobellia thermophila]